MKGFQILQKRLKYTTFNWYLHKYSSRTAKRTPTQLNTRFKKPNDPKNYIRVGVAVIYETVVLQEIYHLAKFNVSKCFACSRDSSLKKSFLRKIETNIKILSV